MEAIRTGASDYLVNGDVTEIKYVVPPGWTYVGAQASGKRTGSPDDPVIDQTVSAGKVKPRVVRYPDKREDT